ncbi:site-specific integrase [Porticoccaceae bacterium]|nr:site-specific integrase [Porticoccaceae bacterium]
MNDNGAFILIVAVLAIPLFIWAYNNDPAANPDLGDQREHDLRHTFATQLRRSGVSLEVRKDLLSHVNSDVTTYYSAGELKELLEAVERLVESDKLPPITPVNKGKVLQFPYNGNKESSRKVAK